MDTSGRDAATSQRCRLPDTSQYFKLKEHRGDVMKKHFLFVPILILLVGLYGCATPLTSGQSQELRAYQGKGLAVEEKNVGAAAALGLLPGGGSFYTRNYGLGVVNLLFWPISILWDPISGVNGAKAINYYATKEVVNKHEQYDLNQLDDSLMTGAMTKEEYVMAKRKVQNKYSPY